MKKYYPLLQKSPLFSGLSAEELAAMLGCLGAERCLAARNQTIFSEGAPAGQLGLVLQGAVQIERIDYFGNRSILATREAGTLFGEAFACAQTERLPVSVVAMQESEIMLLDCRRVLTVCSSACSFHIRLVRNLLQAVAASNLQLTQKLEFLSQRTTRKKLLTYLTAQAKAAGTEKFTIPFDRQALADYLEVERSAMSAELSKLRKEGLLEYHKNHFRLLPHAFKSE